MINTYHKYLNLPFIVNPLPDFNNQGDKALHFHVNEHSFHDMENWLSDLGLSIFLKEVFYTPPFGKIPIHTDHPRYTNHAKINMTWGPDKGVIQWWKSDKVVKKYLQGIGEATKENIIGNWWNAKILKTKTQISPLSGSVKKQEVNFTNKDEIDYKGKKIKLFQYKLKSTENLPDDKKLDFDIWLEPNKGIIFKVKYNRLGSWEYRLKNYE